MFQQTDDKRTGSCRKTSHGQLSADRENTDMFQHTDDKHTGSSRKTSHGQLSADRENTDMFQQTYVKQTGCSRKTSHGRGFICRKQDKTELLNLENMSFKWIKQDKIRC